MKPPILSLRKTVLFLLTVSLLILPSVSLAGSAAQIPSQVEILQDMSRSSQERSISGLCERLSDSDSYPASDKITQGFLIAAEITDRDEEADVGDPDEEADIGDPDEEANVGDPDEASSF